MPYGRRAYRRKNYFGGNRRNYRRNFTRVPSKKIPFTQRKALSRAVAIEVAKGRENKYAAWVQRPTNIPAIIGLTQIVNVMRVIPNIPQGLGEYAQRVGNQITPKSLIIQGWCTLDMTNEDRDYDRVAVKIFCGFPKQFPLYDNATAAISASPLANWSYSIMDTGVGPGPYDGTLNAFQAPVNRDIFTVKSQRSFTLMRPRIYDAITATTDFARSTSGSFKFFKMKIAVPHSMRYGVGTDQQPSNFAPMVMAGYTLLNGATPAPPATGPQQVTISYTARLSYEDA